MFWSIFTTPSAPTLPAPLPMCCLNPESTSCFRYVRRQRAGPWSMGNLSGATSEENQFSLPRQQAIDRSSSARGGIR